MNGYPDDFNALISQMSPEELQRLISLGTSDERDGLLQQQLAQADALMKPTGQQHVTALGGALGGLNDGLRMIGGQKKMEQLRMEQAGLLDKKDQARSLFMDALRRQGAAAAPAAAPSYDVATPVPFSFGGG